MILEIILTILASLLLLFGVLSNSLILTYFLQKSELQRTPYDFVFIDTLLATLLHLILVFLMLILGLFKPSIPYAVLICLETLALLALYFFLASVLTTILVKILFLRFSGTMLEQSEQTVRLYALLARVVVVALVFFLNYIGPFHPESTYSVILGITT